MYIVDPVMASYSSHESSSMNQVANGFIPQYVDKVKNTAEFESMRKAEGINKKE